MIKNILIQLLILNCTYLNAQYAGNSSNCKHNSYIYKKREDSGQINITTNTLIVVLDKYIYLKDYTTKKIKHKFYNPYFINNYASVSKKGKWLMICGYTNAQVLVYDLIKKKIAIKCNENDQGDPPNPRMMKNTTFGGGYFTPSENYFIAQNGHEHISLYNLKEKKIVSFERKKTKENEDYFESVKVSVYDRYFQISKNEKLLIDVANRYYDNTGILIYSLPNGKEIANLKLPIDSLTKILPKSIDDNCISCLNEYRKDSLKNEYALPSIDSLMFTDNTSFNFKIYIKLKTYHKKSRINDGIYYYYKGFYDIETKKISLMRVEN